MTTSSREVAVVVSQASEAGQPADQALDRELGRSGLTGGRAARATALAYAAVRLRQRADLVLEGYLGRPVGRLQPPLRAVLRVGACELLWMERVEPASAVSQYVDIARKRGNPGCAKLANAVLRRVAGNAEAWHKPPDGLGPLDELVHWQSLPLWLAQRWLRRFGPDEALRLARAANSEPTVCLRANLLRTDRERLLTRLREAGFEAEPGALAPEAVRLLGRCGRPDELPGYAEGWFTVQDEGAMLIARLAEPMPGAKLLDLCAAPGGKATHLAELAGDQASILACDRNEPRLRWVQQAAERLGLRSIRLRPGDARGLERELEPVDVVLLDAPCTGTGTLARRPDLRWRLDQQRLERAAALQAELLDTAARLVRPGCLLVYATCSLEPEENERQLIELAERHPELVADAPATPPPGWQADLGAALVLPQAGLHDGFFMARRRRRA